MNHAPLDVAFGLTLMIAGAMIALPENLKAKSPSAPPAMAAAVPHAEQLRRCEAAKVAAIDALQKSDLDAYRIWEGQSRSSCRAAGY